MAMTMRIRAAGRGDAEAIARVYVETWRSTYAGALPDRVLVGMSRRRQSVRWAATIRGQGGCEHVTVAEGADGVVVAFASCGRNPLTELPFAGEVFTLYVQQDHQNQGIGRRLLRAQFRHLMRNRMRSALVWVIEKNPSRFFYEAMGGVAVAEREERLWGTGIAETAYGWEDLERASAVFGPA